MGLLLLEIIYLRKVVAIVVLGENDWTVGVSRTHWFMHFDAFLILLFVLRMIIVFLLDLIYQFLFKHNLRLCLLHPPSNLYNLKPTFQIKINRIININNL